jgi:hypothetical protein
MQTQENPQNVGRAFEIHEGFRNINIGKLISIINREYPSDFDISITKDKKKFLSALKNIFVEFMNNEKNKHLFKLEDGSSGINIYKNKLDTIIERLQNFSYDMNLELIYKIIIFVIGQRTIFLSDYIKTFITDNSCAYQSGKINIATANIYDFSCVKGMYERIVLVLKDILMSRCIGDPNSEQCKPVYKEILKDVFNVNLENAIELDKNELIQKWNQEHLENDEFLQANNLNEGNPNRLGDSEREEFLRNDFIEFMRNQYREQGLLTPQIEEMINSEVGNLNELGVFRNMYFGGKSKRKNKNKTKKNKTRKNKTRKNKKSHKIYKRKNVKKSRKYK